MSISAVAWALKVKIPDPIAKLILISLADHHNESTGLCCPRNALMAEVAGCSERTVIRKLAALRDAGLIEINARFCGKRQTTNSYRLIIGCQAVTPPKPEGCQADTHEGDTAMSPQEPLLETIREEAENFSAEVEQAEPEQQESHSDCKSCENEGGKHVYSGAPGQLNKGERERRLAIIKRPNEH